MCGRVCVCVCVFVCPCVVCFYMRHHRLAVQLADLLDHLLGVGGV